MSSRNNSVIFQNSTLNYIAVDTIPLYNQKLISDRNDTIDNAQEHIVVSSDGNLFLPSLSQIYPISKCRNKGSPIVNPFQVFTNRLTTDQNNDSIILCEVDIHSSIIYYLNHKIFFNKLRNPIIYFLPTSIWNNYIIYVDSTFEVYALKLDSNSIKDNIQKNAILLESEPINSESNLFSWFSFGKNSNLLQNKVKSIKNINNSLFVLREHSLDVWNLNNQNTPIRVWSYRLNHLLERHFTDDETFVLDFVTQEQNISLLIATVPRNFNSDQHPLIQYHICFLNMNKFLLPSFDSFHSLKEFSRDYSEMRADEVLDVKLFAYKDTFFLYFKSDEEVCVGVYPFDIGNTKKIILNNTTDASMLGPDLYVYTTSNNVYSISTPNSRQHYSKSSLTKNEKNFLEKSRPIVRNANQNQVRDLILKNFTSFCRAENIENLQVDANDIIDACKFIVESSFATTYQWSQENVVPASEILLLVKYHIEKKCENYNKFLLFIDGLWNQLLPNDQAILLEIGEKLYAQKGVRIAQHPNENEKKTQIKNESLLEGIKKQNFEVFRSASNLACAELLNNYEGCKMPTLEMFYAHSSIIPKFFINLVSETNKYLNQFKNKSETNELIFFVGSIFQNSIYHIKEFRSLYRSKFENLIDKNIDLPWICKQEVREAIWKVAKLVKNHITESNPALIDIYFDLCDFRVECTRDAYNINPTNVQKAEFIRCRNSTFNNLNQVETTFSPMINGSLLFAEKYKYFEALIKFCINNKDNERLLEYIKRYREDRFLDNYFNYLIENNLVVQLLQTPREYWEELDIALKDIPQYRWMLSIQKQNFNQASSDLINASENFSKKISYSLSKLCELVAIDTNGSKTKLKLISNKIRLIELKEELFDDSYLLENEDYSPSKLIIEYLNNPKLNLNNSLLDIFVMDRNKLESDTNYAKNLISCLVELYNFNDIPDEDEIISSEILLYAFYQSYKLQLLIVQKNNESLISQENYDEENIIRDSAFAQALFYFKQNRNISKISNNLTIKFKNEKYEIFNLFIKSFDFLLNIQE